MRVSCPWSQSSNVSGPLACRECRCGWAQQCTNGHQNHLCFWMGLRCLEHELPPVDMGLLLSALQGRRMWRRAMLVAPLTGRSAAIRASFIVFFVAPLSGLGGGVAALVIMFVFLLLSGRQMLLVIMLILPFLCRG